MNQQHLAMLNVSKILSSVNMIEKFFLIIILYINKRVVVSCDNNEKLLTQK